VFINDDAFLFFLPRMIDCCLSRTGPNDDILDHVVFGLEHRLADFKTLFSPEQRAVLIGPLQYLFGGAVLEWGASESQIRIMRRILSALRPPLPDPAVGNS
jgi:hypothetical protein